jgi:hypothetical protein
MTRSRYADLNQAEDLLMERRDLMSSRRINNLEVTRECCCSFGRLRDNAPRYSSHSRL